MIEQSRAAGRKLGSAGAPAGVAASLAIGIVSYWIGGQFPLVGGPVAAIALGAAVRLFWVPGASLQPGVKFTQKTFLQAAIVLAGSGLTLSEVWSSGLSAIPLILVTVLAGLVVIPRAGRLLGMEGKVNHLVAAGTAICGATAIGAVTPVLGATSAEMAYAISTIFLFNTLAVVVYPLIGHLAGFSDWMFGLWAGSAVHDTSSVLAAAYAVSEAAGQHATVVKLARTTLLLPVMVGYGMLAGGERKLSLGSVMKYFPQFVFWFVAAAFLNSIGIIPAAAGAVLKFLSKFLMVVALAAVGLNTDFATVRSMGLRPMLLGFGASVLIGGISWLLIVFFYA